MLKLDWSPEKDQWLQKTRGISFSQAAKAIKSNLIDTIAHPNQKDYPNQHIFILTINNYIYCVPFVTDKDKLFLKTIYPNRKLTKKYLKRGKHDKK